MNELNVHRGSDDPGSEYVVIPRPRTRAEKAERERDQAVKELERATSFVPEGYQAAKETLPEQVELMAEGLHAFQKASAGINAQLSMAVKEREEALDALKNLYEQGDIDHAEHVLRKHGRL